MMRVATVFALVTSLAGCGRSLSPEPEAEIRDLPATVTLVPGEQKAVNGSVVRFVEVKGDSRCPVDVVCAWAGNAEIVLTVGPSVGDGPVEILTLNTISTATVSARGLTISLVKLDPAPVSTKPTKNYQLEILIERSIQS